VRVTSDCDPPENLLTYGPWHLLVDGGWRAEAVLDGHPHGKGVVAQLASCPDRERAQALRGTPVGVRRSQLPRLEAGDYYWADLVGLDVVGPGDTVLGQVRGLIATGANDVLVVQGDRERLVPYLPDRVVLEVDLAARRIRVDWDPDF
jgi:16S rRNA processing protein RimM